MKKKYLIPTIKTISIAPQQQFLTVSGGGDANIPFGGTDTGGTREPSARSYDDWDDDDDW